MYAYARRKQTLFIFHTHAHCIFFRVLLKEKKKNPKLVQLQMANHTIIYFPLVILTGLFSHTLLMWRMTCLSK